MNHTVKSHGVYGSFGAPTIAVIIPLNAVKDRVVGGYIENIIFQGPLTIPAGSTILISASRKEELSSYVSSLPFDISIKYFSSTIEAAVRSELISKGAEYLELDGMVADPNHEILIGKLGKSSYLSSRDLMKVINRKFCQHDCSPFEVMENIFWQFNSGIVNIRFNFHPFDATLTPPFIEALSHGNHSVSRVASVFDRLCLNIKGLKHVDEYTAQFMDEWYSAMQNMMRMLSSHISTESFLKDYRKNSSLILRYDYHFYCSLKEPTQEKTQVARLLSELTGLNFGSYYSSKRTSAVNVIAVLSDPLDKSYVDRIVSKLCTVFDLNFKLRVLKGSNCIVLNQANFTAVASKIFDKKDKKQIL